LKEAVIWRLVAAAIGFSFTFVIVFIGSAFGVERLTDAFFLALIGGGLIAVLCLIFGPRILDGLGAISF
jgi:hypothetical protein